MSVFNSKAAERAFEGRLAPSPITIVARGTRLAGDLQAEGTLQIEGRIDGSVHGAARVVVAPGGEVYGDIHGPEIVIAGGVHGNVHGGDRVELQAGAALEGDVLAPRVAVLEGATLNGRLEMKPAVPARAVRVA